MSTSRMPVPAQNSVIPIPSRLKSSRKLQLFLFCGFSCVFAFFFVFDSWYALPFPHISVSKDSIPQIHFLFLGILPKTPAFFSRKSYDFPTTAVELQNIPSTFDTYPARSDRYPPSSLFPAHTPVIPDNKTSYIGPLL